MVPLASWSGSRLFLGKRRFLLAAVLTGALGFYLCKTRVITILIVKYK